MKKTRVMTALAVAVAVLALSSCNIGLFQPDANATVSFEYDLSSVLVDSLAADAARASALASEPITGTLEALKSGETVPEVFTWYASIDESTFSVASTKTIVLSPGTYDFSLVLTDSALNHQYYGESNGQAVIDGTNSIDLVLQPLIGDVDITASLSEVASIKAQYLPSDIASLADPRVVLVMSSPAVTHEFELNPATGESYLWFSVTGTPTIDEVQLFNGSIQVGKSVDDQEGVTVLPGVDMSIDLVPLYGETVFNLDLATGDATFNLTIPDVVVDEVGGDPADLTTLFAVYNSSGLNVTANPVFTDAGDGTYTASVTFNDFEYVTVDIDILFYDANSPGTVIGGASMGGIVLDADGTTLSPAIELQRRSYITGAVLAVLGINVFDSSTSSPVSGASVYVDGDLKGHTADGTFGTDGYLKLYLVADTYTITVESGTLTGTAGVDLSPLEIENVDIIVSP